jgi:glucose-1-phosphate cytidylyltransferase
MKVVILCGGQGTRLREHTELLPKPMCTVGDQPLLWHIMRIYAHHGYRDFILALGYRSWAIKEYFLNFRVMSCDFRLHLGDGNVTLQDPIVENEWTVTLAETGEETMTAARIWRVRRYVEGDEPFCVTYGDGVANIDVGALVAFHRAQGTVGTLTAVHPVSRYGQVQLSGNRAMGFHEKAYDEEEWINGGFMVFDGRRVWDYFNSDKNLVLESGVLPAMIRARQLSVYRHDGFWMGMDTAHEYTLLNDLWKSGARPWKVWDV